MGCGEGIRVLPVVAQRAIKAKQDTKAFIFSISQFDQNYDWYCSTCKHLEGAGIKSLTLNFDSKIALKRTSTPYTIIAELEGIIVDSLIQMLSTLSLQDLILIGRLDLFNNSKWKQYWKHCNVPVT